jgi:opacity protein-like surface antigen
MKKILSTWVCLFLLVAITRSHAGDTDSAVQTSLSAPAVDLPAFRAGGHEVELRGGALFSFLNSGVRKPVLDYSTASASFGWMLNDVHGSGFFRGNNEFVLEILGADTFKGPGHYFAGSQSLWRYNFVQPGAKLVPYFELGGGILVNDIYHNQTQRLIGEGFEFGLHSGLGVRWMLTDHWALSFEADYQHVSNAGLSRRNQGLNSLGSTLGINYLF